MGALARNWSPAPRRRVSGRGETIGAIGPEASPWPVGFEQFYRERYLPMLKLASLLSGSQATAEEIVQDAFIRCRHALVASSNPAAYLRAAVVNAVRSHHRRAALALNSHYRQSWLPEVEEPELRELADVLARLSHRQRTVIVLRYFADMSEAEIAETMGCAPGTVKSLSSRAIERLRKLLCE
jgi:RNA polymerase sigma-70 factor (sigma-E family)